MWFSVCACAPASYAQFLHERGPKSAGRDLDLLLKSEEITSRDPLIFDVDPAEKSRELKLQAQIRARLLHSSLPERLEWLMLDSERQFADRYPGSYRSISDLLTEAAGWVALWRRLDRSGRYRDRGQALSERIDFLLKAARNLRAEGRVVRDPELDSDDTKFEGAWVGGYEEPGTRRRVPVIYHPSAGFESASPVLPRGYDVSAQGFPKRVILSVNGVNTPLSVHFDHMRRLSDHYGAQVFGMHNSTRGLETDLLESTNQVFALSPIPMIHAEHATTRALADVLFAAVLRGEAFEVHASSQGALYVALAIERMKPRLGSALQKRLPEVMKVVTYGGASKRYPDGPAYTHFVNVHDPVPYYFGVSRLALSEAEFSKPWLRFEDSQGSDAFRFLEGIVGVGLSLLGALHPGDHSEIVALHWFPEKHWYEAHVVPGYLAHLR